MTFYQGEAVALMKTLASESMDLIYSNPPFDGATQQPWDKPVDWPAFFAEAFRILKPTGNLILHCSVPFNYHLIRVAPQLPSHSWYWKKDGVTCAYLAKRQPMRCVEEILVWRGPKGQYFPKRTGEKVRIQRCPSKQSGYYGKGKGFEPYEVKGTYQTQFLDMKREIVGFSTRPRKMIELIYDHYSQPGDSVLDPFCNQGLSRSCCPGRTWVGIDLYHHPPEEWHNEPRGFQTSPSDKNKI